MTNRFGSADAGGYNRETWLTPPAILAALGSFDLDPCAAPSPRPWPSAERHIELPEDGLSSEWKGRVWCNPPYGAQASLWLDKLATHGNGIALIFARTETAMFHDHVWARAHGVLFLRGRIAFCDRYGKPAMSAGAPSVLIAYGTSNAVLLKQCAIDGHFIELSPRVEARGDLFGRAA